jgi:hypothetical protein
MKLHPKASWLGGIAGAGMLCVALAVGDEPANKTDAKDDKPTASEQANSKQANASERVSPDIARDRAKTMHRVYAATLESLHHHYFHGDRAIVPARAMEDVFEEIAAQSKVEARWISVNTKAMSIGHEPKSDFEKQAAKEIAAGKDSFESIENGIYRRAGAIPLASECVSCHTGFFAGAAKSPRFAGLVISVPVQEEGK